MLRFLGINAAGGAAIGLMLTAMIIYFDLGGLGTRIARSDGAILPILLLALPLAVTFAAAAAGSAIWLMPYEPKFAAERRQDTRKNEHDQEDPDSKPR